MRGEVENRRGGRIRAVGRALESSSEAIASGMSCRGVTFKFMSSSRASILCDLCLNFDLGMTGIFHSVPSPVIF